MNLGTLGMPRVKPDEVGSNAAIRINPTVIRSDVIIPSGFNGVSAGPITIDNGCTVTVPDGSTWTIV